MNDDAGHAAHFLRRIDRLSPDHAELALGLYNDDDLVRYLLGTTLLPAEADRVAIALDDEGQGPFIIVTRAGKFVTCLGKGMKLPPGQVVFSRRSVDKSNERMTDLRALFAKAQEKGRHGVRSLMARVMGAGPALTREEFDDLSTWTPVIRDVYLDGLVETMRHLTPLYQQLSRLKNAGKKHEGVLKAYWQAVWAVSHLTLLVAEDPILMPSMFEAGVRLGQGPHTYRRYFVYELARVWMTPQALRAAWLPARLAKWFLPAFKEFWMQEPIGEERLFLATGLLSIGVRHQKHRARIQKLIGRVRENPSDAVAKFDRWISGWFLDAMNRIDDDASASKLGSCLLQLSREASAEERLAPSVEDMPEEFHATFAANLCLPLWDRAGGLDLFTAMLSQVARFQARDFYLPARYSALLHERYTHSFAWDYVRVRAGADFRNQRKPYVAPPKPGRNEPCSCGSGKKYKRCCGMN